MDPPFGDVPPRAGIKSPSDTLNPHNRLFPGMSGSSPRARPSAAVGALAASPPPPPLPFRAVVPVVSAVLAYGDPHAVPAAGADGPRVRVVGESDACGPQLIDQACRLTRSGDLQSAVRQRPIVATEEDGKGGQVRQNLILTDIGVLWPAGARAGGAGVAVAAPVGRLAVRPSRFEPPPALAAGQQPGQQIPSHSGARRAARRGGVLGGDKVCLADQRGVCWPAGDDPALGPEETADVMDSVRLVASPDPFRSPSSRDRATAWLREETPSLR